MNVTIWFPAGEVPHTDAEVLIDKGYPAIPASNVPLTLETAFEFPRYTTFVPALMMTARIRFTLTPSIEVAELAMVTCPVLYVEAVACTTLSVPVLVLPASVDTAVPFKALRLTGAMPMTLAPIVPETDDGLMLKVPTTDVVHAPDWVTGTVPMTLAPTVPDTEDGLTVTAFPIFTVPDMEGVPIIPTFPTTEAIQTPAMVTGTVPITEEEVRMEDWLEAMTTGWLFAMVACPFGLRGL